MEWVSEPFVFRCYLSVSEIGLCLHRKWDKTKDIDTQNFTVCRYWHLSIPERCRVGTVANSCMFGKLHLSWIWLGSGLCCNAKILPLNFIESNKCYILMNFKASELEMQFYHFFAVTGKCAKSHSSKLNVIGTALTLAMPSQPCWVKIC